jgi:NAD+ synthase/NAD+ synthase (glutamine-hydrolysing)
MRIALLQINPTVGDLAGNARLILEALEAARASGAALAVTPELSLVGYLPRDLLLNAGFVRRSWDVLAGLARQAKALPPVLVGVPEPNASDEGRPLFNTAVLLRDGRVDLRFRKALLPTYDVFDEDRYFEPFHGAQVLDIGGRRLGISVCEDIWNDRDYWKRRRYHHDPIEELVGAGATAVVNLSASPFTAGKHQRREEMLGNMARKHRVPRGVRESVRRQRRSGVRRAQLRVQHGWRPDRARTIVRRRRRHLRSRRRTGDRAARGRAGGV